MRKWERLAGLSCAPLLYAVPIERGLQNGAASAVRSLAISAAPQRLTEERERSSFRELVRSKAVLLLPAFRFARYIAVLGSESTLILKKSILGRLKETLAQSNVL